MRPGLSTIWRIERAATDLPLPLSPTIHRVSPANSLKLMSSTARVTPPVSKKWVLRLRTDSNSRVIGRTSIVGVGGIAQPVAEEVESKHREDDSQARRHQPRR